MKRLLACGIVAAALMTAPSIASAATLLDLTNLPDQTNTVTNLQFTAGSGSTTLSIGGYNIPSFIDLTDIELTLTGGSTNLLGQTFTLTPAAGCSDASQSGPGTFGTNNLSLGATCVSNDTFAQTFGTTSGASYTLSFLLSNSETPNGLLITASDAAVPEPATWAMMLFGFGAMGLFLRFGSKPAIAGIKA